MAILSVILVVWTDFIQSIIKEAHDLANGISPDKRKEIDNKETIDKLKEHFNAK